MTARTVRKTARFIWLLVALLAACGAPASTQPTPAASVPTAVVAPTAAPTEVPTEPSTDAPTKASNTPSTAAWQTVRSSFAHFQIELPGVPTEVSNEHMSAIGPFQTYTATLVLDEQHEIVVKALMTSELFRPDGDGTAVLEAQRDELESTADAQTISEHAAAEGPLIGRDLTIDTNRASRIRARVYLVDNAVYQISALSAN